MSSLNNFQEDHYQDRFQSGVLGFFDKMISETIPNNINTVLGVLAVLAGGVWFAMNASTSAEATAQIEHEELGKVVAFGQQGKVAEQAAAIDALVAKTDIQPTTKAKALLIRADIHFKAQEYDQALNAYNMALASGVEHALIKSAALQGVASTQMQLKQYAEAKASLEQYIGTYSLRSEDPAIRHSKQGKEDLIPFVPSALFKLALVQVELKDTAAAKLSCEKLLKVYPESNEARFATQLLETL